MSRNRDPDRRLYPVTVTMTRYMGAYSDAGWVAFNCEPRFVPEDAFGDDRTCRSWWESDIARLVGRGVTPTEAVEDLERRIRKYDPPKADAPILGTDYIRVQQ